MTDSDELVAAGDAKHRLLVKLGRGGMGTVYLAMAQGPAGFNKLKVLKRLNEELASEPEFLHMFLAEARLSARLNHPNIVQTNEVSHDGSAYFIEMEYLEGQPYELLIRRTSIAKTLDLSMHAWIITQVLAGLHYAHELTDLDGAPLEIVHRDVSPHNVLVTYDGVVKLLDFGIAKAIGSSETRTGTIKGKPAYMAPEQALRGPIDRRVDVFAAGVMLWQAATGRRLWDGLIEVAVFAKLQAGDIPRASSVSTNVPPRIDEICAKAMASRAEDRYATAAEMQEDLEAYIEETGTRPGAKALGKLTTELFADQRARVKAEIERRMKTSTARMGSVPTLNMDPSGSASRSRPPAEDDGTRTTVEGQASRSGAGQAQETSGTHAAIASDPSGTARRTSKRRRYAVAGVLMAGALGSSALWFHRHPRTSAKGRAVPSCTAASDCATLGPRALCSAAGACFVAAECVSSKECVDAHGGSPFVCRKTDGRCVDLSAYGCTPHMQKEDVGRDDAVFFGVMLPTSGPIASFGVIETRGVEIARLDFARMAGNGSSKEEDWLSGPLDYVSCDDETDAAAKAKYLAEEIGVPAVIGFGASKEAVDLGRTEFIPNGVLSIVAVGTSSVVTSIPQPLGSPRLVWRTTPSVIAAAPAVAAVVRDVEEPAVRASRPAKSQDPVRVALLRCGTSAGEAYASAMYGALRFNGKSAVENDANFSEVVYGDPSGEESKAVYERAVRSIIDFRPNIVILFGADEVGRTLLPAIEGKWPRTEPLPRYVADGDLESRDLLSFIGHDAGRRRRILGVNVPSVTLANAQLVTRYNEVFSDRIVTADAPSSAYDSFYLLAYAVAAVGRAHPVTGATLARGIERLLPPGPAVDVGAVHILEALGDLRNGGRINLEGAMSPLDFSVSTGETPVDMVVTCARVDRNGRVVGEMDSGLVYARDQDIVRGTSNCAP